MNSIPSPEHLLAETAWLHSLARRLVGDPEEAADLQQEVTAAALAQPGSAAVGRSWLAAVARNLAVSLRRRRAAEHRGLRALPAPEPAPSPAELVATAELQQRAIAAVLALPTVYRDTVLLRFLRGLSLAATAQAMGVPEETVRRGRSARWRHCGRRSCRSRGAAAAVSSVH
jgi:RNA polymerase sigma-70 factor (ECF subfamily)